MKKIKTLNFFIFFFILNSSLFGQDIERIIKSKPFDFSGRVYVGTSFYNAQNRYSRRAPFSYILSGSPVISIYGIRFPFRFSFNNNKFDFSKPYNRLSLNPSYKWIKLHLGHCNMSFSPYSLSGHIFWGAGIDLNPKLFRFSAMYGTLENVRYQTDTLNISPELLKQYKRKAYGMKLGVGNSSNYFDISLFKAEDDNNSLSGNYKIKPASNVIVGISTTTSLFWKLRLSGNIFASFITENTGGQSLDSILDLSNKFLLKSLDFVGANLSSRANLAGDIQLSMRLKMFSLGLQYKRIDPLYTSFGAYYFYNDFENYTVNSSLKLLKGKLRLKGSYGLQRNNLSGLRLYSNYRNIGSANVFVLVNSHFNLNINYSNYQTSQKDGLLIVNDTLRLAQVNERINISPGFSFGNKKLKHSIRLNASYQKFNYSSNTQITSKNSSIEGLFLNYNLNHKKSNTKFKIGLNYNKTEYSNINTSRYGISSGINKKFLDKTLNTRMLVSWNKNITDDISDGNIISVRIRGNYKINKKQSLVLSFTYLNKNTVIQKPYSEIRGRFSYSLSF